MNQALKLFAKAQSGLFTWQQALDAGYTKHAIDHQIGSGRWHRVQVGVYVEQGEAPSFAQRCHAALLTGPAGCSITGKTALRLFGLSTVDRFETIQLRVPSSATRKSRCGLALVRGEAPTVRMWGMRVVSPAFACIECAKQELLENAVSVLDEALHRRLVYRDELTAEWTRLPKGARGRESAARALRLADGRAESPPESILRVRLETAGLPAPELQWEIVDADGRFVARADFAYPALKLAIEYDGAGTHRDDPATFRNDRRRQNRMIAEGWTVLRFTGADLFGRPDEVIAAIARAIDAAERRDGQRPA